MRSHSTTPVCSANTHGTATETPPRTRVDDSGISIGASETCSLRYPCRAATENGFCNNWRSAKPSNPGPSTGRSRPNGVRFRRLRTQARGVISSRVARHTAILVRFDFYGDESENEAVPRKKGSCEMRGAGVAVQIGHPNVIQTRSRVHRNST
jgi:hypothetical protein